MYFIWKVAKEDYKSYQCVLNITLLSATCESTAHQGLIFDKNLGIGLGWQ